MTPAPDLSARWLARADELAPFAPGAAEAFRRAAAELVAASGTRITPREPDTSIPLRELGWRERLWTAPHETRMTAAEVAEAAGRPKSWVYRHTSPASGLPLIPYRKLDGELVFTAGDVRTWIRDHEDVVVKPTSVTPIERGRRRAAIP